MATRRGLAGIEGVSTGFSAGFEAVGGLMQRKADIARADREEARQVQKDAMDSKLNTARLGQIEESTAALRSERQGQEAKAKVDRYGAEAEASVYQQIYEYRNSLQGKDRQDFVGGLTKAGEVHMAMGSGMRAAALVLGHGSLEPMESVPPEAAKTTKQILGDLFGVDVGSVDGVRRSEDGGIEVLSGGKVVGRLGKTEAINVMSAMMDRGNMFYAAGMKSIKEAQQMVGSPMDGQREPRVLDMGSGRRGLLQSEDGGSPVLREIPQFDAGGKPIATGLSGAKPAAQAEAQPEFAFEFAKQVAGDGTKGPKLPVRIGGKKKTLDISEIMGGSAKDPAYNDAAEEYVHAYIRDVYSRAQKTLEKKSSDGTYDAAEFGRLVVKTMKKEGFAKLLPYAQRNKDAILAE